MTGKISLVQITASFLYPALLSMIDLNLPWLGPVLTEYLAIFHASRLKNSGIYHTEFTHSTSILQVLIIKRSSLEKIPAAISVPTYKLKEMLAQARQHIFHFSFYPIDKARTFQTKVRALSCNIVNSK